MWRNLAMAALCSGVVLATLGALSPAIKLLPRSAKTASNDDIRSVVDRLDAVFEHEWRERHLTPADPADTLIVARRLALGLMGTVPSIEEIRQLETIDADQRIDAYVAHVLGDSRCHDYLAERFARALVGVKDGVFIVYRRARFVSWLSEQLAANRAYDAIVEEMLTAEGMGADRPATNFVIASMAPGGDNPQPDPSDLASRVTRVMLGVRLDCAECHDHPFADWKQRDFHGLAAFFGSAHHSVSGIHDRASDYRYDDRSQGPNTTIEPRIPFAVECLPQDGPERQRLARWITDARNERFALATVNRMWALMTGRGLAEPIDDIHIGDLRIEEIRDNSTDEIALESVRVLADDFRQHGYDLRRLIRVIAASRVFRLDSRLDLAGESEHEQLWAVFPLMRLRGEQVAGSLEQSAALSTRDARSNLLLRIAKAAETNDFLKRYGDFGEDEMSDRGATIPQRLLLMNGTIVKNKTNAKNPLVASRQIAMFASTDQRAIDLAYVAILSRHPTVEEREHFRERFAEQSRSRAMEDLCWTLINSTEFSWNH